MNINTLMTFFIYFTKAEWFLWSLSLTLITGSFYLFDQRNLVILSASLIGTTSLIFNSKGNPFGQFLMVIFSLLYGFISYKFQYYGEMITYLGMTAPMAAFALITWLKNPYQGNKAEVQVNQLNTREVSLMAALSVLVTFIFYFILKAFHTQHMIPSTLSVTTSFIAVYLTFRRSPYFALAYAINDLVLIFLWTLASFENSSYWAVVICFSLFLLNDLYCFLCWTKMKHRQLAKY